MISKFFLLILALIVTSPNYFLSCDCCIAIRNLCVDSLDTSHTVEREKVLFFSKVCRYKYIFSVTDNLKIALQMEFSFQDGNEAGANQQIKILHIHECSQRMSRNGRIYDLRSD